jgi:HAD superfamily phosphoserine phosphatase-like hydrolase
MSEIKAVIFDIDDTLTTENSWAQVALGMGATHEEDLEIYYLHKEGKITNEEANSRILGLWKRKGLATQDNFRKIFDSIPLKEDAVDLTQYLKQKNIKICLITGSMDMYAEMIAKKVSADSFYYNADLYWDDQGKIIGFDYRVDQGARKLEQFLDFCQKNNLEASECVVLGDSENDILLFLESKKGIAVRTKAEFKELEAVAWKVINNLSEIKEFIK